MNILNYFKQNLRDFFSDKSYLSVFVLGAGLSLLMGGLQLNSMSSYIVLIGMVSAILITAAVRAYLKAKHEQAYLELKQFVENAPDNTKCTLNTDDHRFIGEINAQEYLEAYEETKNENHIYGYQVLNYIVTALKSIRVLFGFAPVVLVLHYAAVGLGQSFESGLETLTLGKLLEGFNLNIFAALYFTIAMMYSIIQLAFYGTLPGYINMFNRELTKNLSKKVPILSAINNFTACLMPEIIEENTQVKVDIIGQN